MAGQARKSQILKDGGYTYDFDRMIYFNRKSKKAFSPDFIRDHTEDELERCAGENTANGEWHFYFNSPPSSAVERELKRQLG